MTDEPQPNTSPSDEAVGVHGQETPAPPEPPSTPLEGSAVPDVPVVTSNVATAPMPNITPVLPAILQEMLHPEDQKLTYRINLPAFDGPMELLLHLIKEHEVDIYDIPIATVTREYLAVLELMESMNLEVAGDFLVMAATLMQIKSRMLLPSDPKNDGEEPEDPGAELVRRLLEYKQFKDAADQLSALEKDRGRIYPRNVPDEWKEAGEEEHLVEVTLFGLLNAFKDVLIHAQQDCSTELIRPEITVTQKINDLMDLLQEQREIQFRPLLLSLKTKLEKIVTFLALLELVRLKLVKAYQAGPFEEIRLFLNENAPNANRDTEPDVTGLENRNLDDGPAPGAELDRMSAGPETSDPDQAEGSPKEEPKKGKTGRHHARRKKKKQLEEAAADAEATEPGADAAE